MKTLLIIGGSGFLGKSFFSYFQSSLIFKKSINKIIFLSKSGKKKIKEKNISNIKFQFIKSNIKHLKKLPNCHYIIYAPNEKNNRQNLLALNHFISLLKKTTLDTKILFTSSGAVYGLSNKKKRFKETEKINFNNIKKFRNYKKIYALTKIRMEEKFKSLSKVGYKISIVRLFTFFGEHLIKNRFFAISDLIYLSQNSKFIKVKNNNVFRSYMLADDMVYWLIKILFSSNSKCPIYNVGSDKPISIRSLAILISRITKKPYLLQSKKKKNYVLDYYIPNIKKAEKNLGLKNKINFIKFLKKVILKKKYEN